jgi:hypothetical protein
MKIPVILSTLALLTSPLLAADSSDVIAAAKKLADAPNYSWKQTTIVPEGSQFRPGPTEGKTERDGLTHVSLTMGDNTTHAVMKGDKAAFTDRDGAWQSASDSENAEGRARFMGRMVRNMKTPAQQAQDLVKGAKSITKEGDAYVGELTDDGAKALLIFGRGDDQTVSNQKGSVKFWIKDGMLSKYEYKIQGKVSFNGNDRDVNRTSTVEIKDVGTTKLDVPPEAKRKVT